MTTATLVEVKPLVLHYVERGIWNLHRVDCHCQVEVNILETFEVANTVEAEDIFLEFAEAKVYTHSCVPIELRG